MIGKNFTGTATSIENPNGGKVTFAVGDILTNEDQRIPAVYIQVEDVNGDKVIDAGLSADTFSILLTCMREVLENADVEN
jgi:hypothetical protein